MGNAEYHPIDGCASISSKHNGEDIMLDADAGIDLRRAAGGHAAASDTVGARSMSSESGHQLQKQLPAVGSLMAYRIQQGNHAGRRSGQFFP